MLIVIKLFAEDQSDLDSPELGSPMSSSSELEEKPELDDESLLGADTSWSVLEKVWNMLSVQHCMPLAFSSQPIYLGNENRGSRLQRRRVLRGDTVGPGVRRTHLWDAGTWCLQQREERIQWRDQRTLMKVRRRRGRKKLVEQKNGPTTLILK